MVESTEGRKIGVLRGTFRGKCGAVVQEGKLFVRARLEGVSGEPLIRKADILELTNEWDSRHEARKARCDQLRSEVFHRPALPDLRRSDVDGGDRQGVSLQALP